MKKIEKRFFLSIILLIPFLVSKNKYFMALNKNNNKKNYKHKQINPSLYDLLPLIVEAGKINIRDMQIYLEIN